MLITSGACCRWWRQRETSLNKFVCGFGYKRRHCFCRCAPFREHICTGPFLFVCTRLSRWKHFALNLKFRLVYCPPRFLAIQTQLIHNSLIRSSSFVPPPTSRLHQRSGHRSEPSKLHYLLFSISISLQYSERCA
jgi:hypothetical protein